MHEKSPDRLTYGRYLRVPELTSLQRPLSSPEIQGEMLFIIGQQAEELWFKQILHDLRDVIALLSRAEVRSAVRLIDRVNRVLRVLGEETELLESIPPSEFRGFRGLLGSASGFESEQFRELEWASGLRDEQFVALVQRLVDGEAIRERWPRSLHDLGCQVFSAVDRDPVAAVVRIYAAPEEHPDLFALAESLSEYELRFETWRFRHVKVVERVIGNRVRGTGGSSGTGYLERTLQYQFFPELWEARNRLSAALHESGTPVPPAGRLNDGNSGTQRYLGSLD
jgi:tryptophan 2,3-dioxygenase